MATLKPTFEVDKKGMAMVFARKGKAFVITELWQNAVDENTAQVDMTLEPLGNGKYRMAVEDDSPEGFADLAHAYTLFAESAKKSDPTKRGRFNLGEKLVIAMCEESSVQTTKGTVVFTENGRRHLTKKRKAGSLFTGTLRLTESEAKDIERAVHSLISPPGVTTTFNMEKVQERKPIRTFEAKLRTEISDEDGRLKPTTRKTKVEIYEALKGETPAIYEMGIPVVETGDRFHVNIGQKIPLNTDRDNVPPGFLRDVRVEVLNHVYDLLKPADHKAAWVTNAMEDERCDPEAVSAAFKGRFGEKAVIFDPNDPEANKIAMEQGYSVVPGGALPKAAWKQVKGAEVALPAGQVTPSPNPNEDDADIEVMDPDHYPEVVEQVVTFAKRLGAHLLHADVKVRVANDPTWAFNATYGPRKKGAAGLLTLNLGRLGYKWFEGDVEPILDLLIHEYGHHYCSDHLDHKYLHALSALGARSTMLAREQGDLFEIRDTNAAEKVAA